MGTIKKQFFVTIFIALISLSGRFLCATPTSLPFQIKILALDTASFDDIDLRDSLNRPISSPVLFHRVKNLFLEGIKDIYLGNLSFQKREMMRILSRTFDFLRGFITFARHFKNSVVSLFSQFRKTSPLCQLFMAGRSAFLSPISLRFTGESYSLSAILLRTTCLRR